MMGTFLPMRCLDEMAAGGLGSPSGVLSWARWIARL